MATIQEYYEGSEHGSYQYVTLNSIVQDIVEDTLDEDSLIKHAKRTNIIKHLKRGIRVMNFNSLNEIKGLELEIGTSLAMILPVDYVDWVRVSVLEDDGYLYLLGENRNMNTAKTYLQAHTYEILFSQEGYPLEADSSNNAFVTPFERRVFHSSCYGAARNQNTSRYNVNGEFKIDKERGAIAFSSDLSEKTIVIEYVSDGLESDKIFGEDYKVHKYIVDALTDYVYWQIIRKRRNIHTREKAMARQEYFNSRREAKKRISGIKVHEIMKAMTSATKWV